jgi:hypothetical protein
VKKLDLTVAETSMLAQALRATLEEIDDWEFPIRMILQPANAWALVELLESAGEDGTSIEVDDLTFAMARQALNEVVNGFRPPDFSVIGDRDEVKQLMARLRALR